MINLYSSKDALKYKKRIKYHLFVILLLLVLLLGLIIPLTLFYPHTAMMIVDILFTSLYLSYLYIYFFFIKKKYLEAYQFLAKIQHFEALEVRGTLTAISNDNNSYLGKDLREIKLDEEKILLIESSFISLLNLQAKYNFITMQNVVIAIGEKHDQ